MHIGSKNQSLFESTFDNKENCFYQNETNLVSNRSAIDLKDNSVNQSWEVSNEVYHSMQGSIKPRILKYSLQITQVDCGDTHLAFITNWGHLYTMGNNDSGKLGLGDSKGNFLKIILDIGAELSQVTVPSLVDYFGEREIIQVSCGKTTTSAVSRCGKVYTWGEARHGALGYDADTRVSTPTLVKYFGTYNVKISKVSWGTTTTGFLSTNGDVFMSLRTSHGEVLIQYITMPEKWVDIQFGENMALILTKSGFVYQIDTKHDAQLMAVKIKALETEFITKIACNKYWAAVSDDGALYVWGTSILGKFSQPERVQWIPKSVVDVSLGGLVSGCIDSSGLIWTWGKNAYGELGVGDWNEKNTPYPVMALKSK